jgi:hypothetical protein
MKCPLTIVVDGLVQVCCTIVRLASTYCKLGNEHRERRHLSLKTQLLDHVMSSVRAGASAGEPLDDLRRPSFLPSLVGLQATLPPFMTKPLLLPRFKISGRRYADRPSTVG